MDLEIGVDDLIIIQLFFDPMDRTPALALKNRIGLDDGVHFKFIATQQEMDHGTMVIDFAVSHDHDARFFAVHGKAVCWNRRDFSRFISARSKAYYQRGKSEKGLLIIHFSIY